MPARPRPVNESRRHPARPAEAPELSFQQHIADIPVGRGTDLEAELSGLSSGPAGWKAGVTPDEARTASGRHSCRQRPAPARLPRHRNNGRPFPTLWRTVVHVHHHPGSRSDQQFGRAGYPLRCDLDHARLQNAWAKGSCKNNFGFWRPRRRARCEARGRECIRCDTRPTEERSRWPGGAAVPPGWGSLIVWLRCSLLTDRCGYARRSRLASQPNTLQQSRKLSLHEP
jgi:hypothetical protein